jgi:hypothetical protein
MPGSDRPSALTTCRCPKHRTTPRNVCRRRWTPTGRPPSGARRRGRNPRRRTPPAPGTATSRSIGPGRPPYPRASVLSRPRHAASVAPTRPCHHHRLERRPTSLAGLVAADHLPHSPMRMRSNQPGRPTPGNPGCRLVASALVGPRPVPAPGRQQHPTAVQGAARCPQRCA